MTKADWQHVKHFKPYEFKYPDKLDRDAVMELDRVRTLAEVPMIPTSDYRPKDKKCHGTGKAFDIATHSSFARYKILDAAFARGVKRIGIYDKHIHLDFCEEPAFPEEVVWWGKSK